MFRGLLRPGQGFQRFRRLTRQGAVTASGRPQTKGFAPAGEILGIISQASQKEQEQWKQKGHPITHRVVQRGAVNQAKPTDVLELEKPNGAPRRFLVQGVHDPAELHHFSVYYVEEREDLQ